MRIMHASRSVVTTLCGVAVNKNATTIKTLNFVATPHFIPNLGMAQCAASAITCNAMSADNDALNGWARLGSNAG
jgi:hypothetical protein